jgi:hypothetical protein
MPVFSTDPRRPRSPPSGAGGGGVLEREVFAGERAGGAGVFSTVGNSIATVGEVGRLTVGNKPESWLNPFGEIHGVELSVFQGIRELYVTTGVNSQVNDNKYGHAMRNSRTVADMALLGVPFLAGSGLISEGITVFKPGHPQMV